MAATTNSRSRRSSDARCSRLAWLGLLPLLLGCSGGEDVAASQRAIYDGTPAPEQHSTVGVVDFAGGLCSGSLIAPNLVLTARHCIAGLSADTRRVVCEETTFEEPDSAGAVFVVPLPEVTNDAADYRPVAAVALPLDAPASVCGTDVALLRMKQSVNLPTVVPRVDTEITLGEPYTAVGYGEDEGEAQGPAGIRRELEGREVVCIGDSCENAEVRSNEWVGSPGVCSGDSGGPALDAMGRVFGVVSRGADGCRTPVYADVHAYADWLKVEAISAADAGGYEAANWARGFSSDPRYNVAVGASCTVDGDCPLGVCSAEARCTRACSEEGPCPSGYTCSSVLRCERDAPALRESCTLRGSPRPGAPYGTLLALAAISFLAKCRRTQRTKSGGRCCPGRLA